MREKLHEQGYDREEEYFKRLEKEQIEKMRRKKEEEAAQEGESSES